MNASLNNVTIMSRISYTKYYPSPLLGWYKCLASDIVNNTIYNYSTKSYDQVDSGAFIDTTNTRNGYPTFNVYNAQKNIYIPNPNMSIIPIVTICAWIKYYSSGNTYQVFCIPRGSGSGVALAVNTGTILSRYSYNDITHTGNFPFTFTEGVWIHISVVQNNNTLSQDIYINGNLYTTFPMPLQVGTASPFNSIPSVWNPPKGYIQDIRVYDREVKLPGEYNSIMSSSPL